MLLKSKFPKIYLFIKIYLNIGHSYSSADEFKVDREVVSTHCIYTTVLQDSTNSMRNLHQI